VVDSSYGCLLLSVVVVALRVEMWLIRVMGAFAACGSGGPEG
jgi:hypothetical protein